MSFNRRGDANSDNEESLRVDRGEAPLVPPYILCNFKLSGAMTDPKLFDVAGR